MGSIVNLGKEESLGMFSKSDYNTLINNSAYISPGPAGVFYDVLSVEGEGYISGVAVGFNLASAPAAAQGIYLNITIDGIASYNLSHVHTSSGDRGIALLDLNSVHMFVDTYNMFEGRRLFSSDSNKAGIALYNLLRNEVTSPFVLSSDGLVTINSNLTSQVSVPIRKPLTFKNNITISAKNDSGTSIYFEYGGGLKT